MRRLLAIVTAALVVAGCAGDAGLGGNTAPSSPPQELGVEPEVEIPDGAPPERLVVEDLVVGDGEAAEQGDLVTAHYVGKAWSSGREFDSSWDGEPFSFVLGEGQVIQGWDQGLRGMRVNGRRRLVVPADLAYGERGVPGVIAGDETLVFVVDLLAVEPGGQG